MAYQANPKKKKKKDLWNKTTEYRQNRLENRI